MSETKTRLLSIFRLISIDYHVPSLLKQILTDGFFDITLSSCLAFFLKFISFFLVNFWGIDLERVCIYIPSSTTADCTVETTEQVVVWARLISLSPQRHRVSNSQQIHNSPRVSREIYSSYP